MVASVLLAPLLVLFALGVWSVPRMRLIERARGVRRAFEDRALAIHFRLRKGGWTVWVEGNHARWSWLALAWWDPWVWVRVLRARPPFRSPYQDREEWRSTWLFHATNEWTAWRSFVLSPFELLHIVLSDHGLSRRMVGSGWRVRDLFLAPWDPWGWWCAWRALKEEALAIRALCALRGHPTWDPTHGSFRHDWYRCRCGAKCATLEQLTLSGRVRFAGGIGWIRPRGLSVRQLVNRMAIPAPDRVRRRWLAELDARMDKGAGIGFLLYREPLATLHTPWGDLARIHFIRTAVPVGSPVLN